LRGWARSPHGNAILARGIAEPFRGAPTLPTASANYAFSRFPSFNSSPLFADRGPIFNAAGSSEKVIAQKLGSFDQYDLAVPASASNPRTPFGTSPPEPSLPDAINGVPMQEVVNDLINHGRWAPAMREGGMWAKR
jgi:hypothetical protein